MCYIVFIGHSLHWHYIKIALRKYVINNVISGKLNLHLIDICFVNTLKILCKSLLCFAKINMDD